jgi:peptidoglycan hydrolase-like protein with peptidoglycan-binding domain
LPWAEADIAIAHPRSQWAQWGIVGITGKAIKADGREAALLLPMGRKGPAFLAYRNFTTAYLKWNESLVYSTTAAYLATRLAGAAPVQKGNGAVEHPSFAQIQALQERLSALGYDIGKVDGKIGKGTRAAVKDQQVKLGLPPDSYPAADIIDQLGTGKAARKATKPATKASAKPAAKPAKKPKADAAIEGNSLY